jgi:hypothetical protein
MDEQRVQVDWSLLGQLLRCETVMEMERLMAERGVMVGELMELIAVGKVQLEQEGNVAMIDQLDRSLTLLMKQIEGRSVKTQEQGHAVDMRDTMVFAAEILQLIVQTEGDPVQVYAFLRSNERQLDEKLLFVLPEVFARLIQQINPTIVARMFFDFGSLIDQFPLGNRRLNLEMSIFAYDLPSAYSLKLTQCRSLIYDKYRGKAQAGKGFAAVGVSGL